MQNVISLNRAKKAVLKLPLVAVAFIGLSPLTKAPAAPAEAEASIQVAMLTDAPAPASANPLDTLGGFLWSVFYKNSPPHGDVYDNDANYVPPAYDIEVVDLRDLVANFRAERNEKLAVYLQERYDISEDKAADIVAEADRYAVEHGLKHGLTPEVILAVIAVESTFRERAVSPMGARGLMQVMPRYHASKLKTIGGAKALFDPSKNISVGTRILVDCLEDSGGDLREALLRYNGSLANAKSRYADKVLRVYNEIRDAQSSVG
ncbi:MAG: lytic transglycosylase domain-containing protein [Pseudomonadota bacterium]|nr:lytic transglycosylase domain-containing protein [Pseudomonadota bacterium]